MIAWQCDPPMAGIALWDPPVDTSLIVSYDVFFAQVGWKWKVELWWFETWKNPKETRKG